MNWFKNIGIQRKLFIAFGTIVVLVVVLAVITISNMDSVEDKYDELVSGPLKRQTCISDAIGNLADIRRFILSRGYSLEDEDLIGTVYSYYYYENYQESAKAFKENLTAYRGSLLWDKRLSEEEKQQRLDVADNIEVLFTGDYQRYILDIHEASVRKDREQVGQLLLEIIPIGDVLSSNLKSLREEALVLADTRAAETKAFSDRAKNIAAVIAACIAVLSLIVSVAMSRAVRSPILNMEAAMAEISKGNLAYPIRSGYRDELGGLANRIGDMVDTIADLNKTVTVVDHMDDMICVTDLDYNLIYVNHKMADAYGVDIEMSRNQKCYKAIRGLDEVCPGCQLSGLLPEKESLPSCNYEYNRDDVLGAWVSGKSSIIRWVDGGMVYFHMFRDETRKKEQEERQKRHEEEMREAVIAAEAASLAKSAFLANMSHEIRTPINSIMGFSELAMDGAISPKTRDYLVKITQSSEWLLQIINDILDISKIESGKIELESIPFDLHEVFRLCQAAIMPKAMEKGITLYCYAEPSVGKRLVGDPTRLRQALLNILSNAVKFTNSGVVKLLSSVEHTDGDKVTVHFEVKDSGIGMTREQIGKIFEPFVQADSGTTRKYGGTGLGLAITRNIIELMGSRLEVRSELGIGSRFSFDLKLETIDVPADAASVPVEKTGHVRPSFTGEILLCEDNRMNQQVACEHLSRVGLDTVVAVNGKEGVALVQRRMENDERPFDLILMDIHMPVMDGLEAAARLAELGCETPIVAITANIMSNDRDAYRERGMPDCIAKPFTAQDLWSCLMKYLKPVSIEILDENENAEADEKLHHQLLVDFVKDNRTAFEDIGAAARAGDTQRARRLAHTLKGTAGLIGRTGLREAACDVERFFADGKTELEEKYMKALEYELNTALIELAPLLDEAGKQESSVRPFDEEKARELIRELEPMLKTGNPECLDLIDELRAIPESGRLIEQMEDFDFQPALAALAGIKQTLGVT